MSLKGIVKAVPSGDTLVVINPRRGGPPLEKKLTLSGIVAPRLGHKRDGAEVKDEDFAWESREFLRQLVVGKPVSFELEPRMAAQPGAGAAPAAASDREFATVFLDERNLSAVMVEAGWARAKGRGQDALEALQQLAVENKAGMYATAGTAPQRTVVSDRDQGFNGQKLVQMFKGKPQPAVVEFVFAASAMRVTLLPSSVCKDFHSISLNLCGIRCPSLRGKGGQPDAFAQEAKFFTESRILHRDAHVLLELFEPNANAPGGGQLHGTLVMPQGNIAEALLLNGLGKVSPWSIAHASCAAVLRKAEADAKNARLRIWQNYTPQQVSRFAGKVIEVAGADTLVVMDADSEEHRVTLSSIRAARFRDQQGRINALGMQTREVLRKAVGNKVQVSIEYSRSSDNNRGDAESEGGASEGQGSEKGKGKGKAKAKEGPANERQFGTVKQGKLNLALQLVEMGLVEVVRHRQDDPRSEEYDQLLNAQEEAQKKKKGRWANGANPDAVLNISDLSNDVGRAKAFLHTFQREPRQEGVVDFVVNGGRFKIYLPKHSDRSGKVEPGEPFGNEAYQHARLAVMNRSVEIEIETVDRGGTFLGHVFVGRESLSVDLLRQGLAFIQEGSVERSRQYAPMRRAQEAAVASKAGVWLKFDPKAHAEAEAAAAAAHAKESQPELLHMEVTEVVNGTTVFAREHGSPVLEDKVVEWVRSDEAQSGGKGSEVRPQKGALVAGQFSADGGWYRARITRVKQDNSEVHVVYVDYGNEENLPVSRIRRLDPRLANIPAQAHKLRLSFVKGPGVDEEFGVDAGEFMATTMGRAMVVTVHSRKADEWQAADMRDAQTNASVVTELLKEGLGRLVSKLPPWVPQQTVAEWKRAEDKARQSHLGVWEYGDVFGSDDEDAGAGGRKPRGK